MSKVVRWACLTWLAAVGTWGSEARLNAQAPAAADPFGQAKPEPAATEKPAAEKPPVEQPKDPLVLAVESISTTRPEDILWSIETLLNLGQPEEAKKYAQKLLRNPPDAAAMAGLQRKFGSAFFFRLIREPALQPEGESLGQTLLDAAYQSARDPERLRTLVAKLSDPSIEVCRLALNDLREAGEAGAVALIRALSDANQPTTQAILRSALVELGPVAEGPLVGAMESPDGNLQSQILEVLGRLGSRAAIAHLLRPALAEGVAPEVRRIARQSLQRIMGELPTQSEAEQYLLREANAYLNGKASGRANADGMVTVWDWDASDGSLVAKQLDAQAASVRLALRLAGELQQLAAGQSQYQRLYLTALLAAAKLQTGPDVPLPMNPDTPGATAARAGAQALEDVLALALDKRYTAAALGVLDVLPAVGNAQLLANPNGQSRPVAQALRDPDLRIRFAAVATIVRWDPQQPYPGCSHLPEALGYFARAAGTRRALVGHPRREQSQTLAGVLLELGFEVDTSQFGHDVMRLAAGNPDYEFVLVSDALDAPPVKDFIQQLRRDPDTARLPVGVMAREQNLEDLQRFCEAIPQTAVFPRPFDAEGVRLEVHRVLRLSGDRVIDGARRVQQAEFALDYLARLAENRTAYAFYDVFAQQSVMAQALSHQGLSEKAARVLGLLGSPDAQRTLVTMASQNARGVVERKAAAGAFDVAVRRRGLLLSRGEILLQYDRYNQSASLDRDTQQVLGRILDSIEAPSQRKE